MDGLAGTRHFGCCIADGNQDLHFESNVLVGLPYLLGQPQKEEGRLKTFQTTFFFTVLPCGSINRAMRPQTHAR